LPEEITEVQKRIKFIVHRMETPSEPDSRRRASIRTRTQERETCAPSRNYHLDESPPGVVGREDIEDVVSRWTGRAVTSIKEEETQKLLRIEEELHKRIISQDSRSVPLARAIRAHVPV